MLGFTSTGSAAANPSRLGTPCIEYKPVGEIDNLPVKEMEEISCKIVIM